MNGRKSLKSKSASEVRTFVEMTARHQGWELNGDETFLGRLVDGLAKNYNRYGYFQCPCRDSWDGDRERDEDIICPCSYCEADIEEYGHCFCGLFLAREFARSGRRARRIPERRPDERYP